jgi:ABC-type transporter Mla subunit MlaD
MSDNYKNAAEEATRFFGRVSAEVDGLNTKIIGYAERLGRITKQGNPAEFDAVMKESAADLELFAQQIEALLPNYLRNLNLLTEGFDRRVKSLDPSTKKGAQELQDMKREAQKLAGTAREVQPKVTALRDQVAIVRDSKHDHRLTQATKTVISAATALLAAYEELETFALKVSFSADQE